MSDDNDKLNWLADWFDANDSPGEADEVQQDLRRIAARIAELEAALREIRDQQGAYLPSPRDIARKALESDE